ncbi:MAG: hypothetical protein E7183_07655 [Erysipelotrichaceae bacterium]|nr:hypothetical protein [Erysipelotrichaceae bacterium]
MMKKILLCFTIFIILLFSSCDNNVNNQDSNNHEHSFVEGICSCGEKDPNYHEHSFVEGICSCGEKDPNYHFHSYENGKCSCGIIDPNHTHSYTDGKCVCGEKDPNYHIHDYIDGICSCGEKDPNNVVVYTITFDPLFSDSTITAYVNEGEFVEKLIPDLYEGYNFIGWTLSFGSEELFDFNTPIYNNMILYAVWEEVIIIVEKDYSGIIDEFVPDVVASSLELPTRYDDLRLIWSTSNQYTLNNYGNLIKPRDEEELIVYLTVYDQGELFDFEKNVIVPAIEFDPLPSSNLVFGYYSTWNFFGYTDKMLETCDVINLCFGYVTTDFKIDTASILAVINQVLSVREKGVRVVLSIQGYSEAGTNFSRAAATEEGRITLAESMLRVVEKFHLDGIDIDWEYPGFNTGTSVSVDKANYTLLCKQISETFKKANPDYLITAAIPGGSNGPYRFDLGNVSKYLDYIHIMTYDMQNGSLATHHTALYDSSATLSGCTVASSVQTYKSYGVPSSKIVIGLAFYGKRTYSTGLNNRASGGYKSITYDLIVRDYLSRLNKDVIYGFDETAYAPYLIDKTNGYFITYDDEKSITAKCNYAVNNDLGGVMIWEIGQDTSDTLLSAVYNSMKK